MTNAVALVIAPRSRDIGGFGVRRALPDAKRRNVGPFVFFDHLGPAVFSPGQGLDVRSHPHIGLATVTWLFEGALDHRDSLGTVQTIRPGAVNWMTSGRGITHSERTPPAERAAGHRIEAIQTWVALPLSHEEQEPAFRHYSADTLPKLDLPGATGVLIAGSAFGHASPVDFPSGICQLILESKTGADIAVPDAAERCVYVVSGSCEIDGLAVSEARMAVLKPGPCVVRLAPATRIMIAGGDPLDAPRHLQSGSELARIDRGGVQGLMVFPADWRDQLDSVAGR